MDNILLMSVHVYAIAKHVIVPRFRCRMISFELVLSFCLYWVPGIKFRFSGVHSTRRHLK